MHYACFIVMPYAERTVIGAGQMLDTRFTFDLQYNRLFFAPDDCHLLPPFLNISLYRIFTMNHIRMYIDAF